METPTIPKRIPKYLNLEESIRLLIECEGSPRDHCIITMFLNCALRLSELVSINVEQVSGDTLKRQDWSTAKYPPIAAAIS